MNNMEFAERVANLNITHPRIKHIWDIMDSMRLHRRLGKGNNAPRNLFISGLSGVGKTRMAEKYEQNNPGYVEVDEEGTEYDIKPVVYALLPDSLTIKEIYISIIKALGAPEPRGTVSVGEIKRQAFTLIENQKVEMLILDEVNEMLTSRHIKPKEAMGALKYISNKAKVCLVCIGNPDIEDLRNSDFQCYRRFPIIKLERFVECNDEFCEFLSSLEKQINPYKPIGLGKREGFLPEFLFHMCKGLVGILTPVITEAYTILGLFQEGKIDYTKMELSVDVLDQAYKNVVCDVSEDEYENMIAKQEKKRNANS